MPLPVPVSLPELDVVRVSCNCVISVRAIRSWCSAAMPQAIVLQSNESLRGEGLAADEEEEGTDDVRRRLVDGPSAAIDVDEDDDDEGEGANASPRSEGWVNSAATRAATSLLSTHSPTRQSDSSPSPSHRMSQPDPSSTLRSR